LLRIVGPQTLHMDFGPMGYGEYEYYQTEYGNCLIKGLFPGKLQKQQPKEKQVQGNPGRNMGHQGPKPIIALYPEVVELDKEIPVPLEQSFQHAAILCFF